MKTWFGIILPTLKKAGLILAVLVFLALIAGTFFRQNKKDASVEGGATAAPKKQQIQLTQDSDSDGLKDWEEAIYRTDPHNADTDGDGAKDGEEIAQNRNPLQAGPGDFLAASAPTAGKGGVEPAKNITDRLIQLFGAKYFAQRINDPDQPLDVQEIANDIAQNIPSYQSSIKPFLLKDLTILKNSTPENIKNWAKSFDAINEEAFAGINEAEISILIKALSTEDYSLLAELDKHITAYNTTLERMRKLVVPSEFASFQLRFMNIALELRELAQNFKKADKDVLAASSGVQSYLKLASEIQTISQNVKQELRRRNLL
ncbi:MAG: hypothetical protein HYW89_02555 [Candidatus Sungiibacteriota bacterium]|uniref:Thrombospondin type 3 repeat superfamily protein n=1 Tax=Candidatus Sungiibacteriota bacterium TaxID=2750080 RepID=A0A7T5UQX2_9BACT|nr:MAG: hypothetical protein HYW89_02555 [Candidatus Sungbacteria bacterium]